MASLAPGDLNRVFFVSGGSEAIESAWKLARQYYSARGEQRAGVRQPADPGVTLRGFEAEQAATAVGERRWKAISRHVAYHGTTMGALSINGIPALRTPFEPLVPDVLHVRNTNRYHRPPEETEEQFTALPARRPRAGDRRRGPRDGRDGDHGAGPERRRVRSRRPRATGEGVREICDRYGILLCADEVITGFGRSAPGSAPSATTSGRT